MVATVTQEGFQAWKEKRRDLKLVRKLEREDTSESNLLAALLRLDHVRNEADQIKVFNAFKRASEFDLDTRVKAFSLYYVATAYEEGFGVRKNRRTAERRYQESAESGGVVSMYRLGMAYKYDERYEEDLNSSHQYYEMAAKSRACSHPGEFLADCSTIREYIERKNEQVALWARETLGEAYYTGKSGLPKNDGKAEQWFDLAAEAGSARAKRYLRTIRSPSGKPGTELIFDPPRAKIDLEALGRITKLSRAQNGIDCEEAFKLALKYLGDPVPNYKYAARYLQVAQQFGKQGIDGRIDELKQRVGETDYNRYLVGWSHVLPVEDPR